MGWYKELRQTCEHCPVICVANKIDLSPKVTKKKFKFASRNTNLDCFFTSAAAGDNVASLFETAIKIAWQYQKSPKKDFMSEVMDLLESSPLDAAAADAKE